MAQFLINIAGFTGRINSLFDSTKDYCRKYLTDGAPDFSVTVSREDLAFEQEALRQEALEEGIKIRKFTDPFLERTAIQRKFAEHLFDRDTLMVHGSLVAVDGIGYLFTAAKCGTGKSTHTRLWREVFGDRAVMVNDDKPFLAIGPEGVTAWGAPWSGKHGLDANVAVPLGGICLLERGMENRIRRAEGEELMALLGKESYCPQGKEAAHGALVERLTRTVPLWRMACNREREAALVAYEAMGEGLVFPKQI